MDKAVKVIIGRIIAQSAGGNDPISAAAWAMDRVSGHVDGHVDNAVDSAMRAMLADARDDLERVRGSGDSAAVLMAHSRLTAVREARAAIEAARKLAYLDLMTLDGDL